MDLKDFIFTPLAVLLVLFIAYLVRPLLTNSETRIYYFPALIFKITCAILLGVLYQHYYGWGDTFNYHTFGSVVVRDAIYEDPINGLKLLFSNGNPSEHPFKYVSKIPYFTDSGSFFVIQIATIFDLFTFGTYSATAVMFSVISFIGSWLMFKVLYDVAPQRRHLFAGAILFFPSVVFWGSGILKDTITLSALGIAFYSFYMVAIRKKVVIWNLIMFLISVYILYIVKIYILLCLIPPLILWWLLTDIAKIRKVVLKWILMPAFIILGIGFAYLILKFVSEDNPRYSLNNLAKTAQITAYDIAFWTGKDAGSTYTLGELDGTYMSLLRLAPEAVNVSLFRPYLWEVMNPLMVLSAIESLFILISSFVVLWKSKFIFLGRAMTPLTWMCITFSLVFAFAVGVSTFNFGTLSRYKIPLLPFYLSGLILLDLELNRLRKSNLVAETEN